MIEKQTVLFLIGAQASGKTTFANELLNRNKRYVRLSRDQFRHMLTDYQFTPKNEKIVSKLWDASFKELLKSGKSIIVDEMNLNEKYLNEKKTIAKSVVKNINFVEKRFNVTLDEAIERDKRRPFSVGEKVIRQTFRRYSTSTPEKDCYDFSHDFGLDLAFIFDVDGTLARKGDRDIFDMTKVELDTIMIPVAHVARALKNSGHKIIIMSGRDGSGTEGTKRFLERENVYWDEFLIRPAGDTRRDSIIKEELYNNHVRGKYHVLGVFDDRIQVLDECWQGKLGLFTFDVRQDARGIVEF